MRLIDAENISFYCNYEGDCTGDIDDCKKCENYICNFRDIQEQPTAYVNKVVEKLEQRKAKLLSYLRDYEKIWDLVQAEIYSQIASEYTILIEIVKQGGVSDDVCEYKIKDKVIYADCNNKQIASAFCWFNECGDYKYCPYCGKKIKVVE